MPPLPGRLCDNISYRYFWNEHWWLPVSVRFWSWNVRCQERCHLNKKIAKLFQRPQKLIHLYTNLLHQWIYFVRFPQVQYFQFFLACKLEVSIFAPGTRSKSGVKYLLELWHGLPGIDRTGHKSFFCTLARP